MKVWIGLQFLHAAAPFYIQPRQITARRTAANAVVPQCFKEFTITFTGANLLRNESLFNESMMTGNDFKLILKKDSTEVASQRAHSVKEEGGNYTQLNLNYMLRRTVEYCGNRKDANFSIELWFQNTTLKQFDVNLADVLLTERLQFPRSRKRGGFTGHYSKKDFGNGEWVEFKLQPFVGCPPERYNDFSITFSRALVPNVGWDGIYGSLGQFKVVLTNKTSGVQLFEGEEHDSKSGSGSVQGQYVIFDFPNLSNPNLISRRKETHVVPYKGDGKNTDVRLQIVEHDYLSGNELAGEATINLPNLVREGRAQNHLGFVRIPLQAGDSEYDETHDRWIELKVECLRCNVCGSAQ